MDQDTMWYGGRPRPRQHCVRWGPTSPLHARGTADPHFSAHCSGARRIPTGLHFTHNPYCRLGSVWWTVLVAIATHLVSFNTTTTTTATTTATTVFWRLFVKRFTLCYQTIVCPVCLSVSVCPVCDVGVLATLKWHCLVLAIYSTQLLFYPF